MCFMRLKGKNIMREGALNNLYINKYINVNYMLILLIK